AGQPGPARTHPGTPHLPPGTALVRRGSPEAGHNRRATGRHGPAGHRIPDPHLGDSMPRILLLLLSLLVLPAQALELKPFSASYTADWKQVPISGSAARSLKALDNKRWELNFQASMLVASLNETSTQSLVGDVFMNLSYRFYLCGTAQVLQ